MHLVRCVMDEVFGSDNFISQIAFSKTTGATVVTLPGTIDYLLWYAKDRAAVKYRQLFFEKQLGGAGATQYDLIEELTGLRRPLTREERDNDLPQGRVFCHDNLTSQSMGRDKGEGAACWYKVELGGQSS